MDKRYGIRMAAAIRVAIMLIVFVLTVTFISPLAAPDSPRVVTKVVIKGGENFEKCKFIEGNLTKILNSIENLEQEKLLFTKEGYRSFKDLIDRTGLYCVNVMYEANLITIPSGGYEVRGIRVRSDMRGTKGNPDQYLVFTLDARLCVSEVHFAIEEKHVREILEEGAELKDFANRQKILQFIEIFRTAYNREDIDYLQQVYSDDALIIVGKVLKAKPGEGDMLKNSFLTQDKITFVKLSKAKYLEKLAKVFQANEYIKVNFDEVEVIRHDSIKDIYGVTLKQRWESPSYSDEGYMFLMVDFVNPDNPLIHVRTWQPEPFPDGSVICLYDFNIIQ